VVKSHGGADSYSFFFAIQTAIEESKNNVLEKIQKQLELEMPLDISSSEHI
jgi:glycerol-3-phosphate acyltransferase PlsX